MCVQYMHRHMYKHNIYTYICIHTYIHLPFTLLFSNWAFFSLPKNKTKNTGHITKSDHRTHDQIKCISVVPFTFCGNSLVSISSESLLSLYWTAIFLLKFNIHNYLNTI